jgi:hypothetical protein
MQHSIDTSLPIALVICVSSRSGELSLVCKHLFMTLLLKPMLSELALMAVIHSLALAASALHMPLSCYPTLTPVLLSRGFTITVLDPVSITPSSLSAKIARLIKLLMCQLYHKPCSSVRLLVSPDASLAALFMPCDDSIAAPRVSPR